MPADWWLSLGLGAGLGMAYGLSSYVTAWFAARQPGRRFLVLLLGGMLARMAVALALLALALAFVPMHRGVLAGSFLLIFSAGLVAEVALIHRNGGPGPNGA